MINKFTLIILVLLATRTFAQQPTPCASGKVYAVDGVATTMVSAQQGLVEVNPSTGVTTFIANLFDSSPASNAPHKGTSAIAVDPTTNTLWYITRNDGPRIYSYNLTTGVYGGGVAIANYPTTTLNINKASFNPIDHKLYFHSATSGVSKIWSYDPTQAASATNPKDLGNLTISGRPYVEAEFQGGDIAFDGLGNLTGVFSNGGFMVKFPAMYNASNVYTGISTVGQKILDLGFTNPTSVAFLTNGNYIVGSSTTGLHIANTNSGSISALATGLNPSDLASCATPQPMILKFEKTARVVCKSGVSNVEFRIEVKNEGQFLASNTTLKDQVPSGLTVTSGTLNGNPITGISNASLNTGILIKSPAAQTDGVLGTDAPAIIILNMSVSSAGTYSNQAYLSYQGIQADPNAVSNQLASDNPGTPASKDATSIQVTSTTCSILPVTLANFTVRPGEVGKMLLNWSTTAETNSERFEIEHSLNGKDWNRIGRELASKESDRLMRYAFVHENPVVGQNLYRLKMIDRDQTYAYSRIVAGTLNGLYESLAYPNPATDMLFLSDQIKGWTLYDLTGRAISTGDNAKKIDLKKFTPGLYILEAQLKNGGKSREKIVVNGN